MPTAPLTSSYTAPTATAARFWRWLTAAAIFGDIVLNYWWNAAPGSGQTMGAVSAKYPTLLTPVGWAFAIWGPIFLAQAIYAVWQLLPAQRPNPLPDAVARPLTVANVAAASWVVCFGYELIAACVALMLLTLGALIVGYGRARRLVLGGSSPAPSSWPLSLFLGWISVATVVTLILGLRDFGLTLPLNVSVVLCVGFVAVVVALGLLLGRHFRDALYPLVLAWGLYGIWFVRRFDVPELGWVALAGALVVALGGLVLAAARRRRA